MPHELTFTVWGKAVGKQVGSSRQGFTYLKGNSRAYIMGAMAAARVAVRDQAWAPPPRGVPVGVTALIYVPVPESWSKKTKAACIGLPAASLPDSDNVLKGLYDAMMGHRLGPRTREGLVFADDTQVAQAVALKVWCAGPEARVDVSVRVLTGTDGGTWTMPFWKPPDSERFGRAI